MIIMFLCVGFFSISLSNIFSCVKWQEVECISGLGCTVVMFKMNTPSTCMYQNVTTWFLFWSCVSLLSARSSQDTAFLSQEMV